MAVARSAVDRKSALPEAASADEVATPVSFADRHRKFLLGCLAVVLFFAGVSTRIVNRRLRWALAGAGCVVLVCAIAWIATFPVSLDV